MQNYVIEIDLDNEQTRRYGIGAADEPAAISGVLTNIDKLTRKKFRRIAKVTKLDDFIGEMA